MKIKRDYYLNKLIQHKKNGLVKIVTGVRRCGKSYLLFQLFRDHLLESGIKDDHIISIALDDYGNRQLLDPDELYRYVKSRIADDEDHYILLDEIQLVKDFESVVNGFLHIPNADVYVTGSNSKFLSSDVVTEFRGRGDEIRIFPLNFSEFYSAYGGDFNDAWLMFCNYGGMPLCLSMQTQADKAKYLTNLFETTYLADIINRNKLRGNVEINELTDILASSIGSLTNPLKLSNTFASTKSEKLSANTISAYLGYLQDAFLIEKALRASGDAGLSNYDKAFGAYRRIFDENCTYKVKPYPGVVKLLADLRSEGLKLGVLSNKPDRQAVHVVRDIFGEHAFDCVHGQREGIPRKPDPAPLLALARELGAEPSEVLYIGDSEVDVATGKAAHMDTVAVAWGFRSREELQSAGAARIADTADEILQIIKK